MTITINGSGTIAGVTSTGLTTAQTVTQSAIASGVAGTGPAFSAYSTSNQAIGATTNTKVLFDTEDFDTNSNFASSRFTPTVAGYYQINATVGFQNLASYAYVMVFKNGSFYKTIYYQPTTSSYYSVGGGGVIVSMNGSTDYIEIYAFCGTSINIIANTGGGNGSTQISGVLVRSA